MGIEARPSIVERRECLGDWEINILMGKNLPGLVSMVERKSKYMVLRPIKRCQAELVEQATVSALQAIAERVHTITDDIGKEFARQQQIAEALQAEFYIAHPYAAWERGTNENPNGFIRHTSPRAATSHA